MDDRPASLYRIAAVLLIAATALCCTLSLVCAENSDADEEVKDSGTCGPNLEWGLDEIKRLTITGTGDMVFDTPGEPPWKSYMGSITTVAVDEGVTSIADGAFYGCTSLFEVINLSEINIVKGSEENGYIAYYAKNVFTSPDDATVSSLDGEFVYGYSGDQAYLIKYLVDSTVVDLPVNVQEGEYIICTDLLTSPDVGQVTFPEKIVDIEEGAFGDLVFYDEDGETELDITAYNMRGATFANGDGKLIKQPADNPSYDKNKMPDIVLWIAAILSLGIIGYAAYRY